MAKKKKKKLKRKKSKRKLKKLKRKKTKKSKKKLSRIKKTKSSKSSELFFKVPRKWSNNAYVNKTKYEKKYKFSINNNESFWRKEGKRIKWIRPYTKVKDVKFSKTEVKIKWFYDGTLNASANCIDRHLKDKKNIYHLFSYFLNFLLLENFLPRSTHCLFFQILLVVSKTKIQAQF